MERREYKFKHRNFRCGQSNYYYNEILDAHATHSARRLAAISQAGFSGIWLRAELRELVPGELFGKYIRSPDARLESLRKLCRRAKQYGLDIWLYFTEPLGLPQSHRFRHDHPTLGGPSVCIPSKAQIIYSNREVKLHVYDDQRTHCAQDLS